MRWSSTSGSLARRRSTTGAIRRARQLGKHAGILVAPGKLLDAALDAGCDLAFYAGDIMDLSKLWVQSLGMVRSEASEPHADVPRS